jgi:UDP-glucuronate decarboxylase
MSSKTASIILQDSEIILNRVDFSELGGKTILITGASGLVGHYLVAALRLAYKKGVNISKVYLVTKSEPTNCFADLTKEMPVDILRGDLTDVNFQSELPMSDYIIHAAGYGQPGKFMDNQVKTLAINTISTLKLFEKLNPGGKYLFLSTSEVYNGLNTPPFKEDQIGTTNTDNFRSCYIEGKRSGEAIVYAYRNKGVHASSARLSLAYGPGTRADDVRVINEFIKKALFDNKIELKDMGTSMRTYLYVTDAVEILFNILFKSKEGVYNVGGHSRTSILELAKSIGKSIGIPVITPEQQGVGLSGAPDDVYMDMSKAECEFEKTEYISFQEGLEKTIQWQKSMYLENKLNS